MTDTTDIVARLRAIKASQLDTVWGGMRLLDDLRTAADRIEALEAEVAKLRGAANSALKRLEKGAPGWGVAKDELRAALKGQT